MSTWRSMCGPILTALLLCSTRTSSILSSSGTPTVSTPPSKDATRCLRWSSPVAYRAGLAERGPLGTDALLAQAALSVQRAPLGGGGAAGDRSRRGGLLAARSDAQWRRRRG